MSLFTNLPFDIQRFILFYLSDKELDKIDSKALNEDDIFWTMKSSQVGCRSMSKKETYKLTQKLLKNISLDVLFQLKMYDIYLSRVGWDYDSLISLANDDVFLKNYINCKGGMGKTILRAIVEYSHHRIPNRDELVTKFLAHGADVNTHCSQGATPLIMAAYYGQVSTVKILLSAGAQVDIQDTMTKRTALIDACYKKDRYEIIDLLLKAGANPNIQDDNNSTALEHTLENKDINSARRLISSGMNINYQGRFGLSPLAISVDAPELDEITHLLLDVGADVNYQWRNETTILILAIMRINVFSQPTILDFNIRMANVYSIVERIVKLGADVNKQDKDGESPLMHALRTKNLKIIELLLDHGADLTLTNKNGIDVLAMSKSKYPEAFELINKKLNN
jgi:ankyrin repeat protein